jgi:NTE family protein
MSEQPVDLVFEGGGVKGIGLAGAFLELYERGCRPECVAGTSAGAITAALVAAGYTGEELRKLVFEDMHFPLFEDRPRFHLLGTAAGEVIEVLRDRGLHSGQYFLHWIDKLLQDKGKTTFGHFRDPGAAGTNREYKLQVIASDLTDHSMLVLPRDATKLGIAPEDLSVAEAVRMSMSIPVFFDPVIQKNPKDGRRHMIVDGGMLSPIGYVRAIAETMMQAHDRFYVEQANYVRTIPIPTCGVSTTQFDISPEKTKELFQSGQTAAQKFLNTWDFDAYKKKFREGPAPGRRAGILE